MDNLIRSRNGATSKSEKIAEFFFLVYAPVDKNNFSESKYEPRFKLLEIRENEAEVLRNRYEVSKSKWEEAKALLVMNDHKALAND